LTRSMENGRLRAIVTGATGETGKMLVRYLVQHSQVDRVTIIVRNKRDASFFKIEPNALNKLTQIEVPNFDDLHKHSNSFEGHNAAFSCLGTTRHLTPSQEDYRRIEMYAVEFAKLAAVANIARFYLLTAEGANSKSWLGFYLKTKGEVEEGVTSQNFSRVAIFRPALILGIKRSTRVFWEIPVARITSFINPLLPVSHQEIHLTRIAQSMLSTALQDLETDTKGVEVFGVEKMYSLTPDMSNFPEGWLPYDGENE